MASLTLSSDLVILGLLGNAQGTVTVLMGRVPTLSTSRIGLRVAVCAVALLCPAAGNLGRSNEEDRERSKLQ